MMKVFAIASNVAAGLRLIEIANFSSVLNSSGRYSLVKWARVRVMPVTEAMAARKPPGPSALIPMEVRW